jgi:hypothetical protein
MSFVLVLNQTLSHKDKGFARLVTQIKKDRASGFFYLGD